MVEGNRPTLPLNLFQHLRIERIYKLIQICWHDDPMQRPFFTQIVKELETLQSELLALRRGVMMRIDSEIPEITGPDKMPEMTRNRAYSRDRPPSIVRHSRAPSDAWSEVSFESRRSSVSDSKW